MTTSMWILGAVKVWAKAGAIAIQSLQFRRPEDSYGGQPAKDRHILDLQGSSRRGSESICLPFQEFEDFEHCSNGRGCAWGEGQPTPRDIPTRRARIHGHGRRSLFFIRAGHFALRELPDGGWLKDKFGVSWQIIPTSLGEMMQDKDPEKSQRGMEAMVKM